VAIDQDRAQRTLGPHLVGDLRVDHPFVAPPGDHSLVTD
jgi:hypothetical protein